MLPSSGSSDAADQRRLVAERLQRPRQRDRLDRGPADVEPGDDAHDAGSVAPVGGPSLGADADSAPTHDAALRLERGARRSRAAPEGDPRRSPRARVKHDDRRDRRRQRDQRGDDAPVADTSASDARARQDRLPAAGPRASRPGEQPSRRWVRWSRPPVDSGTPRRAGDADQRRVEDRQPDQQCARASECRVADPRLDGDRHRERGDQEPDRHAAAVAEEDPRRAGEVPAQERRRTRRQRERDGDATRPSGSPRAPIPSADTRDRGAGAVRLSIRLNALTMPTTQTIVSTTFTIGPRDVAS